MKFQNLMSCHATPSLSVCALAINQVRRPVPFHFIPGTSPFIKIVTHRNPCGPSLSHHISSNTWCDINEELSEYSSEDGAARYARTIRVGIIMSSLSSRVSHRSAVPFSATDSVTPLAVPGRPSACLPARSHIRCNISKTRLYLRYQRDLSACVSS